MRYGLILFVVLAGCAAEDPLTRPGLWHPVGANDANLAAMVADPNDLVTGVVDPRMDGQVAAAAVARYRAGKVKDLPDTNISRVGPAAATGTAAASGTSGE